MINNTEPVSELTCERPDIWLRAIDLAAGLTGYTYARKEPLPDGTIYACGGYYIPPPPDTRTPLQRIDDEISNLEDHANDYRKWIKDPKEKYDYRPSLDRISELIREKKKERDSLVKETKPIVHVPEGAMEWLLHEVGHYVAATSIERQLPNYGLLGDNDPHSADREWQAWALEEIVLEPFGHARDIAPPSQRDGVGYSRSGPVPERAMDHIARQLSTLPVDLTRWQRLYAEWVSWRANKWDQVN